MKALALTCILWLILCVAASAQKYLQLERAGSLKTIRFTEGDMLTFRLRDDDKGWYERMILSIDTKTNRIIFPDVVVHIDSIDAIRLNKKAVVSQILGTTLQVGGVNIILFTAYYSIFQDVDLEWASLASGAANIVVGTILKKLFRHKTFRISDRKRVRLLDLYFREPADQTG